VDQCERKASDRALTAAAARNGAVLPELVPGRSCGTCTLCCKVYAIRELNKPPGRWCVHAERSRGCTIYEKRPDTCRLFHCMWLLDARRAPEWKPEKAHFVVALDLLGHGALTVALDPGRPDAWKKEPYYSTIRAWAKRLCPESKKILVIDHRGCVTVVLPDRDVPIGVIGADTEIVIFRDGDTYNVGLQPREAVAEPRKAN